MTDDDDFVTIKSPHGRIRIHKHWLDPIPRIIYRAARKRAEGSWRWIGEQWVFVPYKEQEYGNR